MAFSFEIGKQNTDEDEFILREIVNFKEAIKMIKKGKVVDSKTVIAMNIFQIIIYLCK